MALMFLSQIADGMSSDKTVVPNCGDGYDFKPFLKQHIQAVLQHGRRLIIFRTFQNIRSNANTAAHCFLLALEQEYLANNNKLPPTVYHQIDGGSENTAKLMIAMCELVVAARLCFRLVLTRLPVGHTHEDIDAIFALIWNALLDEGAITPQENVSLIVKTVRNKEAQIKLFTLRAIPNYKKWSNESLDGDIGYYAKVDWTQLQIILDAVPVCSMYPTGVMITYRGFASDEVTVIMRSMNGRLVRVDDANLPPQFFDDVPTCPSDAGAPSTGANGSSTDASMPSTVANVSSVET